MFQKAILRTNVFKMQFPIEGNQAQAYCPQFTLSYVHLLVMLTTKEASTAR